MDNIPQSINGSPEDFTQDTELAQQEGGSDLSLLLEQALSEVTGHMDAEEKTAYLADLFTGESTEQDLLLFANVIPQVTKTLIVTNYKPDQAMREASLARESQWTPTKEGEITYLASNALEVYLGTPDHPLEILQALQHIRQLSESTVLTSRILLGLWNSRRYNNRVSRDGSVAILVDEILKWQGIQKHSRLAHPGSNIDKRYTEGYRAEQRQRVITDLALLAKCNVRGHCTISVQGRPKKLYLDGPYLRSTTVKAETNAGTEAILGFLVAPGGWINAYEQHHNYYLAEVDNQIFTQLHPVTDRYALRLALYLTERWREQARDGNFSEPIVMSDLLAASMIEVDRRHLTTEFAPAIEKALDKLQSMEIIGKQICLTGFHTKCKCLHQHRPRTNTKERNAIASAGKGGESVVIQQYSSVVDDACLGAEEYDQARWGKEWLGGTWEILPPLSLIRAYSSIHDIRRKSKQERKRKGQA